MIYTFTAGETVSLALLIEGSAAAATGATVRAALKPRDVPDAPEAALFSAVYSTAAMSGPPAVPGWTLTLTPAQSAALAPGDYETDARITLTTGAVIVTEPVNVRLLRAITGPGT